MFLEIPLIIWSCILCWSRISVDVQPHTDLRKQESHIIITMLSTVSSLTSVLSNCWTDVFSVSQVVYAMLLLAADLNKLMVIYLLVAGHRAPLVSRKVRDVLVVGLPLLCVAVCMSAYSFSDGYISGVEEGGGSDQSLDSGVVEAELTLPTDIQKGSDTSVHRQPHVLKDTSGVPIEEGRYNEVNQILAESKDAGYVSSSILLERGRSRPPIVSITAVYIEAKGGTLLSANQQAEAIEFDKNNTEVNDLEQSNKSFVSRPLTPTKALPVVPSEKMNSNINSNNLLYFWGQVSGYISCCCSVFLLGYYTGQWYATRATVSGTSDVMTMVSTVSNRDSSGIDGNIHDSGRHRNLSSPLLPLNAKNVLLGSPGGHMTQQTPRSRSQKHSMMPAGFEVSNNQQGNSILNRGTYSTPMGTECMLVLFYYLHKHRRANCYLCGAVCSFIYIMMLFEECRMELYHSHAEMMRWYVANMAVLLQNLLGLWAMHDISAPDIRQRARDNNI